MSEIEILDAWLTSEIKDGKEEIKKLKEAEWIRSSQSDQLRVFRRCRSGMY